MNLDKLSEAELMGLNRQIEARLKVMREVRSRKQMSNFNIGDRVTFQPPEHDFKTGIISKCNQKTMTVVTGDGQRWNVAPVFLHLIVEDDSGRLRNIERLF